MRIPYRKGIIDPDKEAQKWASKTGRPPAGQDTIAVDASSVDDGSSESSDEDNDE